MSGHTSGPWEWDNGRLLHNVPNSHSETVLMVHDPVWQPTQLDARLIAAAPDLKEACVALEAAVAPAKVAGLLLVEAPAAWANIADALKLARAAISKATGQAVRS